MSNQMEVVQSDLNEPNQVHVGDGDGAVEGHPGDGTPATVGAETAPLKESEEESDSMSDVEEEEKAKDVTGDGGVVKEIMKAGEGSSKPASGSEVTVHYVGRLPDGTQFDSSRDRNEPFKFKLGEGQVIKGWEEVVKTMKKGEISKVTLKPEYGYGSAGSPPKIPPDATLVFEIELLSWEEEKDLTSDGGVLKKVLLVVAGPDKSPINQEI
eukprot:TRINITY_DN16262_c0_g1_i2.p1 TRINITY_DN16262_c0_g1~~TRINITY_DN16262_c0_g1_i2.p1  ORF type:complete len:211 (+),score=49.00 TRINITY_DN16262_c0_g1_i2:114-746(+)